LETRTRKGKGGGEVPQEGGVMANPGWGASLRIGSLYGEGVFRKKGIVSREWGGGERKLARGFYYFLKK